MNPSEIISTEILDVQKIRQDFPILSTKVNGRPLVYLDNAASSQKPWYVLNAIEEYYTTINSNVHRGVHHLSQKATDAYELSRKKIADFIGAANDHEVIFTRGTTESINLVAYSFGKAFVKPGDEIIISAMEHHSNIVPWQICCEDRKASLKVIPINEKGELIMEAFEEMLSDKVKLVAVNYISNSLGTINPVKEIIALAHARGIPVLLDAAQAIQHVSINVQELDVDFLAFSGHKMYGPTGIGILYGKERWLNLMPPYQGGGEMIRTVRFEKTTYNDLPFKFEAGTPNIEAAICLGSTVDYIRQTGLEKMAAHEHELLQYATEQLLTVQGLRMIGTAANKASVASFIIDGLHPYDVGVILDKQGVAVRTGHHCTEPLMDFFRIPGTIRASFAFYNTMEEVDILLAATKKAVSMLR